jgi:hypothetical protein
LNDLDLFLEAINESYVNFEDQIGIGNEAMKISSDELLRAIKIKRKRKPQRSQQKFRVYSQQSLDVRKSPQKRLV